MQDQNILKDISNSLNLNQLYSNIQNLSNVTTVGFQAQSNYFKQNLPQTFQNVNKILLQNSPTMSKETLLGNFLTKIRSNLPRQIFNITDPYLVSTMNLQKELFTQKVATQIQNSNKVKQDNNALGKQIKNDQQQLTIDKFNDIVNNDVNQSLTPIQRSIKQYNQLLVPQINNIMQTQPAMIPQSMRFLSKYAQLQGAGGVGPISNGSGSAYVGVTSYNINGKLIYQPFPVNNIKFSTMPNVQSQFQFHANNTINSWNTFVKNQSQMLKFVKKVSDPKKRQQYVKKQLSHLNINTFSAQVLATLTYYYVYLTLQNYVKNLSFDGGQSLPNKAKTFFQNYQVGFKQQTNPLYLKNDQAKQLARFLLNIKPDDDTYTSKKTFVTAQQMCLVLAEGLKGLSNQINNKQIQTCITYVSLKSNEATAFFFQAGIQKSQYSRLLQLKSIQSIKKKMLIKGMSTSNNQYQSMINTIVDKQESKSNQSQLGLWTNTWDSSSIYCYDYLFKY